MKLLLTSAGITNKKMADALKKLAPKNSKVAFIPTAQNVNSRHKEGMIEQINLFTKLFGYVDFIDPSANDVDWKKRLRGLNVFYLHGGNTFHLLNQLRKTGFGEWLKRNINKIVYVGNSASTISATPSIEVATIPPADDNFMKLKGLTGLGLVDFLIEPHCDAKRFEVMKKWAEKKDKKLYAIDDNIAIQVVNGRVEIVGTGKYKVYNE